MRLPGLALRAAHLAVLSSFALAQPLFDILGRNATFFVVRDSSGTQIVLLALAVTLLPPALLILLELGAGLIDRVPRAGAAPRVRRRPGGNDRSPGAEEARRADDCPAARRGAPRPWRRRSLPQGPTGSVLPHPADPCADRVSRALSRRLGRLSPHLQGRAAGAHDANACPDRGRPDRHGRAQHGLAHEPERADRRATLPAFRRACSRFDLVPHRDHGRHAHRAGGPGRLHRTGARSRLTADLRRPSAEHLHPLRRQLPAARVRDAHEPLPALAVRRSPAAGRDGRRRRCDPGGPRRHPHARLGCHGRLPAPPLARPAGRRE